MSVLSVLGFLAVFFGVLFSFSSIYLILPVLGVGFYSLLVFYLRRYEDV